MWEKNSGILGPWNNRDQLPGLRAQISGVSRPAPSQNLSPLASVPDRSLPAPAHPLSHAPHAGMERPPSWVGLSSAPEQSLPSAELGPAPVVHPPPRAHRAHPLWRCRAHRWLCPDSASILPRPELSCCEVPPILPFLALRGHFHWRDKSHCSQLSPVGRGGDRTTGEVRFEVPRGPGLVWATPFFVPPSPMLLLTGSRTYLPGLVADADDLVGRAAHEEEGQAEK